MGAFCLLVCLPACLPACMPTCLRACLPPACLPACLSVCLPEVSRVVLGPRLAYTQVSVGYWHIVLLRRDGEAIAFGNNEHGQCDIPSLPAGLEYTQVSAGVYHTALLRSDGHAFHCSRLGLQDRAGQCRAGQRQRRAGQGKAEQDRTPGGGISTFHHCLRGGCTCKFLLVG